MEKKWDTLIKEMIVFLQNWGLWNGTTIYANGKWYKHTYEKEKTWCGVSFVEMGTEVLETDGGVEKTFVQEHRFGMICGYPLYELLRYNEYRVNPSEIQEKAWERIFHTNMFCDYFFDMNEVYDVEDLFEAIQMGEFNSKDYIIWDPLVFDTWEDYIDLCEKSNQMEWVDCENTEYEKNQRRYAIMCVEDVMPLWNQLVFDARIAFREDCRQGANDSLNHEELVQVIKCEWMKLFQRYGLWYDFMKPTSVQKPQLEWMEIQGRLED